MPKYQRTIFLLAAVLLPGTGSAQTDSIPARFDSAEGYPGRSPVRKSILFQSFPDSTYPTTGGDDSGTVDAKGDTLELPPISSKAPAPDSMSKAFKKYWARVEREEGIDQLREQIRARDIDHSWIPHWYFFDSTVVLMPLPWIIFRSKHK